jgi:hypothetical protein
MTARLAELLTPASGSVPEFGAQAAYVDAAKLQAEASLSMLCNNSTTDAVEVSNPVGTFAAELGVPGEKLTAAPNDISAPKAKKSPRHAATIRLGEFIETDQALTSTTKICARTTLALADTTDASKGYKLSNFYNLGSSYGITMTIDAENGTVSIPKQAIYNHSTYGEVSFMKVFLLNGKLYMSNDPVTGTIDENGNITTGNWGIVVTNTESSYYGATFFTASSAKIRIPNAHASAVSGSDETDVDYSLYVDQNSDNSVSISGFFQPGNVVVEGRIKSDRTLTIPSVTFYTNAYYGAMNCFPATWSNSTGTWKASIDTKNPLVFDNAGDNVVSIPGWVVAAAASPSSAVAYSYRDYSITFTNGAINWPAAPTVNFEGSGTEASPYLLKSAADLTALSQLVLEGNAFTNTYFALANDIDMSSVASGNWIAIGDISSPFNGVFDGKGHTISKLTFVNKGFNYAGIFGYGGENSVIKNLNVSKLSGSSSGTYMAGIIAHTYGTVDNCNVASSALTSTGMIVGGIAGISYNAISNCSFTNGSITGAGTAAGILGQGTSAISNCYVIASITTNSYVSTAYDCAGLVGVLQKGSLKNCWMTGSLNEKYGRSACGGLVARCFSSTIEDCFSTPTISTTRSYTDSSGGGDNYTGGLVGYISDSNMSNCYTSSPIVKSGTSNYCGGLVGYLAVIYTSSTAYEGTRIGNVSNISNCYFSGYINSSATTDYKYMYGKTYIYDSWKGESPDVLSFNNCHYDRQMSRYSEDTYGRYTSYFTNGLPEGYDASVWEAKAGYYPTLKNVGAGTQAQALASVAINLPNNQSIKKVKGEFTVSTDSNVNWAIYGASNNESTGLKLSGNTFSVKDIYSNEVVMASSADGNSAKMYSISVVPKLFDGEGTAESPYLIKNVSDFSILDKAVTESSQSHEGDYFAMTNDIDCTPTDDVTFSGVGNGGYEFAGNFDGRGYSVKNLSINALVLDDSGSTVIKSSKSYCGLFGVSSGTVKNVTIDKSCTFALCSNSGSVVGYNLGTVDNCRNYADVKSVSTNNGGVVGLNSGTVSNCYNAGRISCGNAYQGGIAGQNVGTLSMCQNDGNVVGESNDGVNAKTTQNSIGGIAGYSSGTIELCVNNGEVTAKHSVGGIAGRVSGINVSGCLNNGLVTALQTTTYRGAIFGYVTSLGNIANNYYDSSININGASNNAELNGVTGLSTSELTTGICPAELASLDANEVFDFSANAYPVLKQFVKEDLTKALRTMYVAFAPSQVRNNIQIATALSPSKDVQWSLEVNSDFKLSDNNLTVTVPSGMTVAADTLTAANGNITKTLAISSVPEVFNGEGTIASPYLIESKADWNKLADFVEASGWEYNGNYFRVTKDIDFEGDSIRVIAHDGINFQATLDGAGHTVKGYVYANANTVTTKLAGPNRYIGRNIGVFGTIGGAGTVKNITFDGDFTAVQYIGGVCGALYGTLDNVKVKGSIYSSSTYCSGMAYRLYEGATMKDCVNEGSVSGKSTYIAGLVGEAQYGSDMTRCYNRGTVTAGTNSAAGVAFKLSGGMTDCGNEGTVVSNTGTIAGVVMTVDSTAYMVRCYNKADLGSTSMSNVFALVNTFSERYNSKAPGHPDGGYVTDCYNTGNITAKDYGYGFANKINDGWKVTNCYNTGDITSSGLAAGFASTLEGGTADDEYVAEMTGCYNTGNISGNKATVAGLVAAAKNYTRMTDCYNTGNVTNANTSGNTTGGLVGQFNGVMTRCFNTGTVTGGNYAVGGLVGYISNGQASMPGRIYSSFNLGDVTSTYTGTTTNGDAGGLAGYIATGSADYAVVVDGCFNAGNVTANQRVGGLVGGMFSPYHAVTNCYNSGRVTALKSTNDAYLQSGTVFTINPTKTVDGKEQNMLQNCSNVFYDKTVFTGAEYRSIPGSAKTTSELKALEIGDGFVLTDGYPVIKDMDAAANKAGSIMILVSDESSENHDMVTDPISLVAPQGTTWQAYEADGDALTVSSKLDIDGTTASPKEHGDVVLVATTPDNYCRTFRLSLAPEKSGVKGTDLSGKAVSSVVYVDLQGRVIANPTRGNVYVVRTNYVDGTYSIAKMVAK